MTSHMTMSHENLQRKDDVKTSTDLLCKSQYNDASLYKIKKHKYMIVFICALHGKSYVIKTL